jgi:argininosuccinate lyase
MPQKRNPDFAEVTRARAASVQALAAAALASGRGALSGYNRDTQWTKYWVMDLAGEVGTAPLVFARVVATLEPDRKALARTAGEDFIAAVDLADHLARTRSIEFRRVYHIIARATEADAEAGGFRLETINGLLVEEGVKPTMEAEELREAVDPLRAIHHRPSLGGPAPEDTARQARELKARAAEARRWARKHRLRIERAKIKLNQSLSQLTAKS